MYNVSTNGSGMYVPMYAFIDIVICTYCISLYVCMYVPMYKEALLVCASKSMLEMYLCMYERNPMLCKSKVCTYVDMYKCVYLYGYTTCT